MRKNITRLDKALMRELKGIEHIGESSAVSEKLDKLDTIQEKYKSKLCNDCVVVMCCTANCEKFEEIFTKYIGELPHL